MDYRHPGGSARRRVPKVLATGMVATVLVACSSSKDSTSPTSVASTTASSAGPSTIYVNGNVLTLDAQGTTGQAVAVAGGTIVKVGANEEIQALAPAGTPSTDLQGATVLPGFIDPHSHMAGYSIYDDPANWVDVSAINAYFKPPPGDPRCTTPDDPQQCFIPVRNQDDVVARIQQRLA